MAICTACGENVADSQKFCTGCGAVMPAVTAPVMEPPQQAAPVAPASESFYAPAPPPPPVYAAPPPPQQPIYAQQQPVYAPPQNAYEAAEKPPAKGGKYAPVGAFGYIGYMILFAIPILGLILQFMWAFDKSGNVNRRGLARAYLILMLISLALVIFLAVVFGGAVKILLQDIDFSNLTENPAIVSGIPGIY